MFGIGNDTKINYRDWERNNGTHTTIIFNSLIFMQIFNAFISRILDRNNLNIFKNITKHHVFIIIQTLILVSQVLIIHYGGRITRTRPLRFSTHVACFLISSLTLLTLPICKYLPIYKEQDPSDDYYVMQTLESERKK